MRSLDEIAQSYGTDKSSLFHNYTKLYTLYFEGIRNEKIKILEIGIDKGFSLKSWKEYFLNADITGIDIVNLKHLEEERVHILTGSQSDIAFLDKVNNEHGPFDIIIDDGSHHNSDMKTSFEHLFPLLKEGGLYIVEDLHSCYWGKSHNTGEPVFIDVLKKIIDDTNARGKSGTAQKEHDSDDSWSLQEKMPPMDWWEKNVEFIHVYRSIAFIKKYPPSYKSYLSQGGTYLTVNNIQRPIYPEPLTTRLLKRMVRKIKRFTRGIPGQLSGIKKTIKKIGRHTVTTTKILFNRVISLQELFRTPPSLETLHEYRKNIKIYDAFIFFNELDLLDIRFHVLNDYVDYFVLVEATKTFTGIPKPLYYRDNKHRFEKFNHKVIHVVVDDMPNSRQELYDRLATSNTLEKQIIEYCLNTDNIPHDETQWLREFYQKEQIKKGLTTAYDTDICYVSDSDEIRNPKTIVDYRRNCVHKMEQKMYTYYLNNRSSEKWQGTFVAPYRMIKNASINHLDTPSKTRYIYITNGGWHFTNQGGADRIREKIESYGHQEFNNESVKSAIENRIAQNQDFVGRKFKLWIDESDLPAYIIENKAKYSALFP